MSELPDAGQAEPLSETTHERAPSAAAPAPPWWKSGPLSWLLGPLMLLLAKGKMLLGLLKFASLGKFALTALSMGTMILFEASRSGPAFAVGFVVLILIHELGHGVAIKHVGLEAGWPIFIPFIGAAISMKSLPKSEDEHAFVAYAGPVAGTAASLVCAAIGLSSDSRIWLVLAATGFFLNLFNLIPIQPLDGGRVAAGISKRSWIVGAILLVGTFFYTHAPQLLLIAGAALFSMRGRGKSQADAMRKMTDEEKSTWTYRYFGLCFFLGAAMYFTERLLSPVIDAG